MFHDGRISKQRKRIFIIFIARGHNLKTVKTTFDKIEKAPRSVARKKMNSSIATTSVIFSAEFNPSGPNISEIINQHRDFLETGDTLKQLFPKISIIVASKRRRNLQELFTRAGPYNIKSDSLNLNVNCYKKCDKKCDSLVKPFLLYQKQLDGNVG